MQCTVFRVAFIFNILLMFSRDGGGSVCIWISIRNFYFVCVSNYLCVWRESKRQSEFNILWLTVFFLWKIIYIIRTYLDMQAEMGKYLCQKNHMFREARLFNEMSFNQSKGMGKLMALKNIVFKVHFASLENCKWVFLWRISLQALSVF